MRTRLQLLKFLMNTSGHVWTANELRIAIDCSKSALYRNLADLKEHNLIVSIGDTYSFNAEQIGNERNITIIRKNLRRNK